MISATVGDVLKKKGPHVITMSSDQTVADAVEIMARHNIGAVLITTEGGICGIFTERDYMRKVASTQFDPRTTKVMSISSCNLVAVDPTYTVVEAMAIMTEQHCRHLPVMDQGHLVGLVSIGDLVKQASEDQKTQIHYLTDYVTGRYPA
jgi:CBS domain-containing protein